MVSDIRLQRGKDEELKLAKSLRLMTFLVFGWPTLAEARCRDYSITRPIIAAHFNPPFCLVMGAAGFKCPVNVPYIWPLLTWSIRIE